ncbi:MAG: hypothetical protein WA805_07490, partial [Trebonia sp.]|uniref:hypothetical protein n=1 Tax=Trebonia sp. TaxID=2767075 RepID=UPI003CAEA290
PRHNPTPPVAHDALTSLTGTDAGRGRKSPAGGGDPQRATGDVTIQFRAAGDVLTPIGATLKLQGSLKRSKPRLEMNRNA